MLNAALSPSAEALAKEVCDRLLKKGLLKAKPEFIRKDREAKLAEIFGKANLDGGTLPSIGGRKRLEVHLLSVTAGEACAWLGNVVSELAEMVQDGALQVRSGRGEVHPRALANKVSAEQAGAEEGTATGADRSGLVPFDTASDGLDNRILGTSSSTASPPQSRGPPRLEAVAARVCTRLVEKGLLKTKPAFVRSDREASICTLLRKAGLEGAALTAYSDRRSLELRLQGALNGEACAWLDNVVVQLVELSQGAGVVDTPRSMASCSTSDSVKEMPPQKRVSFSAAPAEVLHVVPYSETYILHPDKFEFDSDGSYITDDKSIAANLRSTVCPSQPYRPPSARDSANCLIPN